MLTPSEVEQYHEIGQVTAAFRLKDDIITAIQERAETLFAARPDLDHDYIPNMIETDPAGNWIEFGIATQILGSVTQLLARTSYSGDRRFPPRRTSARERPGTRTPPIGPSSLGHTWPRAQHVRAAMGWPGFPLYAEHFPLGQILAHA